MSGGCASAPGKKQASREELIATLRSLEPLQSKGRIPRAKVVAAFDLEGVMHRRESRSPRSGYCGVAEEWSLPSGMWLTGMVHVPLTREDLEFITAMIDALIEGKSPPKPPGPPRPPASTSYVPTDPRVPEFYDTIKLLDRKGRVIASLELDYRRYRPCYE